MEKRSVRDECLQEQDRKRSVVPMSHLDGIEDMKEGLGSLDRGRIG